ncbi:uncharacterized protein LOC106666903 isoform X2 [Cimex lectularius]|nr:uncharacterized protein LOC106666903 isoform X2 [Cimex lectularius]XP_014249924.1 uncharacterized protein LOC106666903 isoform X2 [Cimex lectularius]
MGKKSSFNNARYSGRKRGVQRPTTDYHSRDFHRSNLTSAMDAFNCSRAYWHNNSPRTSMTHHKSNAPMSNENDFNQCSSVLYDSNQELPVLPNIQDVYLASSHRDVPIAAIEKHSTSSCSTQTDDKQDVCSVNDPKLSELLERVFSQKNVTEDNVADIFIRELVSALYKLTDVLVENKLNILKVIALIIKLGGECSDKTKNQEPDTHLHLSSYKSVEFNDPRINEVCTLMEIDKKIEALMKKKMELYPLILRPTAEDIINLDHDDNDRTPNTNNLESPMEIGSSIKIKTEIETDEIKIKNGANCSTTDNCVPMSNVNDLCQKQSDILRLVKQELLIERVKTEPPENGLCTDDSNTPCNLLNTPRTELQQESSIAHSLTLPSKPIEAESVNCTRNYSQNENSSDSSFPKYFDVPAKNNKITCLQTFDQLLIAGSYDGCLMLFSTTTGHLVDMVFPHEKPIVSVTVCQNKIITASHDSWLKCYNLVSKKLKSLSVSYPISCTEEIDGILFVGTTTGRMNKFNIKSMTYIASAIQISPSMVIAIKSYNEHVLVVACEGKPVSLRDASNGAILQTLKLLNNLNGIVLTSNSENIIGCRDDSLLVLNSLTGQFGVFNINIEICFLKHYKGVIFVAGHERDKMYEPILLCYSESIVAIDKIHLPKGKPLALFVISCSNMVVSTDQVGLTVINLPKSVSDILRKK